MEGSAVLLVCPQVAGRSHPEKPVKTPKRGSDQHMPCVCMVRPRLLRLHVQATREWATQMVEKVPFTSQGLGPAHPRWPLARTLLLPASGLADWLRNEAELA